MTMTQCISNNNNILTQDPNIRQAESGIRTKYYSWSTITVFSKSVNPLDLPQKSTIRAIFEAKSVDPKSYSPPSWSHGNILCLFVCPFVFFVGEEDCMMIPKNVRVGGYLQSCWWRKYSAQLMILQCNWHQPSFFPLSRLYLYTSGLCHFIDDFSSVWGIAVWNFHTCYVLYTSHVYSEGWNGKFTPKRKSKNDRITALYHTFSMRFWFWVASFLLWMQILTENRD